MSFYENYFADKRKTKKIKTQPQMLELLYSIPKKDTKLNMPHFYVAKENAVHQADLLYLPNDNGYKYALVVVDIATRMVDAVPLKVRTSDDVLKGFRKIYSNGILSFPQKLEVDSGTEFKGAVLNYFQNKGATVRVAKTSRHRQQAIVERRNQIIGTALLKRQTAEELLTGNISTDWVADLPILIQEMNKKSKRTKFPKPASDPVCQGDSCNLLAIGDMVRVILEKPVDITSGKRLHGSFRSGDIRWDPKPRIIKEILIKPGYPPLYLLSGNVGKRQVEPVAYTKNQLQVIPKNELKPDRNVIRNEKYEVEKLLSRKKIKNKIYYKVLWKNYPLSQATYEPRSELNKFIPQMIAQYESKH